MYEDIEFVEIVDEETGDTYFYEMEYDANTNVVTLQLDFNEIDWS